MPGRLEREGLRVIAVLGAQAPDASVAARLALAAERHDVSIVVVHDVDPVGAALAVLGSLRRRFV